MCNHRHREKQVKSNFASFAHFPKHVLAVALAVVVVAGAVLPRLLFYYYHYYYQHYKFGEVQCGLCVSSLRTASKVSNLAMMSMVESWQSMSATLEVSGLRRCIEILVLQERKLGLGLAPQMRLCWSEARLGFGCVCCTLARKATSSQCVCAQEAHDAWLTWARPLSGGEQRAPRAGRSVACMQLSNRLCASG